SLGQSTSMFFMARTRYDTLLAAARQALERVATEATTREFVGHFDKQWLDAKAPVVVDPRHKIVALSGADADKWRAKVEPIIADWAQSPANGEKALETSRQLYSQAGAR